MDSPTKIMTAWSCLGMHTALDEGRSEHCHLAFLHGNHIDSYQPMIDLQRDSDTADTLLPYALMTL